MLDEIYVLDATAKEALDAFKRFFKEGARGVVALMDLRNSCPEERLTRILVFGLTLLAVALYLLTVNSMAAEIVSMAGISVAYWWGFLVVQMMAGATLLCLAGNYHDSILEFCRFEEVQH